MVKPLKVLAVVSSIVLVGGYLAYRSGAGERILPSSKSFRARPVESDREGASAAATDLEAQAPATTRAATAPATQPADVLFYGSKSGVIARPSDVKALAPPPATQPVEILFPGSKSAPVLRPSDQP